MMRKEIEKAKNRVYVKNFKNKKKEEISKVSQESLKDESDKDHHQLNTIYLPMPFSSKP